MTVYARLGRYVRWIADEIGLRDWHFDIDDEPPEDPEMYEGQQRLFADVCPTPGRRQAKIRVCEDFRFGLRRSSTSASATSTHCSVVPRPRCFSTASGATSSTRSTASRRPSLRTSR